MKEQQSSGQIMSFSGGTNPAEVLGLVGSPDILHEFLKNMDNSAYKTLVQGVILEQINRLKGRLEIVVPGILDDNIKYFPINLSSTQEILSHLDSLSTLTDEEIRENSARVARILSAISDFVGSGE